MCFKFTKNKIETSYHDLQSLNDSTQATLQFYFIPLNPSSIMS